MSKPMDHIAYLSDEIGPRPAGTEEEQQAALYITECFQKETRFPVEIEDFTCSANADMPRLICYIVAIVAVLAGLFIPMASIPAIIVSLLAAAVLAAESLDKPLLSQLFMRGVSQNVVAKYEPVHDPSGAGARRRKVILVANYDSGKVRHDLAGFLPVVKRPLEYATIGCMFALPIVLLLRQFAFAGEGFGATACLVLALVLLVPIVIPAVFVAIEKAAAYNEGANSNASGVAVMLEVARRISDGEAEAAPRFEGVMHDEQAAYDADVVPEGATLSYEHAAGDIAGNLVQVKEAPLSDDVSEEELSRARKETRHALASAPIDTLAAAAAKAAELHEAAEAKRIEEEEAEKRRQEEEEQLRAEEEMRQAALLQAAEEEAVEAAPTVPEWYLKATEKARKSGHAVEGTGSAYRSRYADFPDERVVAEESAPVEEEPFEIKEIPGSAEPVPYEEDYVAFDQDAASDDTASDVQAESADENRAADEPADAEQVSAVEEEKPAAADAANGADASDAETEPAETDAVSTTDDRVVDTQAEIAPADADAVEEGRTVAMPVIALPDATTALSAVADAGSLDLDALRAAASLDAGADHVDAADGDEQGASSASYAESEERSAEMRERALKERSVVTLTADEVEDMSVQVEAASPVIPAAQVASILPEDQAEAAREQASRQEPRADAAVTAVLPGRIAASAPDPAPAAAKPGDRVIEARVPMVDLPSITLPSVAIPEPISFDELRQRAPLASAAESKGKKAATDLLSISLPTIEGAPAATGSFARIEEGPAQTGSVSMTGSFAPVGAIGVEPVGDELIQDVDPEDIYVDDADDSVFEEEFTETGAFAGPGYVEMPQSRVGRFFGKFRRKKKEEEQSAHEWLDVDEDFDARSAGKARGGWESFREEDDWQGGAFSSIKARLPRSADEGGAAAEDQHRARLSAPAVSHDAFASALAAANAAAEAKGEQVVSEDDPHDDDVQRIYSFAAGDINTEVWFVALGSELAGNGGIKAFLAEHASDMRGAIIVNLESLGAGRLSYLEKEGRLKQTACPPRMKRFIRKASQAAGVGVESGKVDWRESAASYAQKHRMQAMTLAGMDGDKPAYYGAADDVIENIDADSLDRSADVVIELLKNI